MPLVLDRHAIDRWGDRAAYRQLADRVREAITRGDLRPGESMPSEGDLAAMSGLSRTAVRDGLDLLVAEGLIVKRAGSPTRVATPPPKRRMATRRYQEALDQINNLAEGQDHPLTSAFTEDHGIGWDAYRVQADYQEDTATREDAKLLAIAPGTPVLRRQLVKLVDGVPVQIQESVIPLELVKGTAVADPSRQPWPGGTIAELHSVGLVVSHVSEEARARTPSTAERRLLEMEAAGAVWDIVRVFHARPKGRGPQRPVECSTVVTPAANLVLAYETDLSP